MLKNKHYLGLDSWEARAMAELESEMVAFTSAQAESGTINHGLIQKLFALDRAQSKELAELRGTVKVLTEMLMQSGGVDEEIFGYRMEAEMDRLRAQDEAARADESRIECAQCNTRVPKASTHIAAFGAVCDACHYGSG